MSAARSLALSALFGVVAFAAACTDLIGVKDYVAATDAGTGGQMESDATAVVVASDAGMDSGRDGASADAGHTAAGDDGGGSPGDDSGVNDSVGCGTGSYCALVLAANPSAYFRFDDTIDGGAKAVATDTSGHGVLLTVSGTFAFTPSAAAPIGDIGNGLSVGDPDGSGTAGMYTLSAAAGGTEPKFSGAEPFTLEAWVCPPQFVPTNFGADPTAQDVFSTWVEPETFGGGGFRLAIGGPTVAPIFEVTAASAMSTVTATGAFALTAGTFVHLAATFDGTTASFYVNGAVAPGDKVLASGEGAGTAHIRTTSLFGLIDEMAIYSRALSATEIQSHAAFTSP